MIEVLDWSTHSWSINLNGFDHSWPPSTILSTSSSLFFCLRQINSSWKCENYLTISSNKIQEIFQLPEGPCDSFSLKTLLLLLHNQKSGFPRLYNSRLSKNEFFGQNNDFQFLNGKLSWDLIWNKRAISHQCRKRKRKKKVLSENFHLFEIKWELFFVDKFNFGYVIVYFIWNCIQLSFMNFFGRTHTHKINGFCYAISSSLHRWKH